MFSAKKIKMAAAAFALGSAMVSVGIAHAQSVVVRSTGPSQAQYPKGKKLPANARVTLKKGDRVTVLDKSGSRVLSGPGTYTLDGQVRRDQTRSTRVAGFLSNRSTRRARTGAVRGAGNSLRMSGQTMPSPNLWFIDVAKGGTYCVANPATQILWRSSVIDNASGQLSGQNAAAPIEWRRGNALKSWPHDAVPLVDGGSYQINVQGMGGPQTITTRLLGNVPDDLDQTAALLIEKGCDTQLELLVTTLEASDGAIIGGGE